MLFLSKSRILVGISVFTLILTSCSSTAIKPGTQSIKMLLGEHHLMHCQFLGDVSGTSKVNLITRKHPPYVNRMIDARNSLRNAAHKLGSNTIHIRRTTNTSRYEFPGLDKKVTLEGRAYFCDES